MVRQQLKKIVNKKCLNIKLWQVKKYSITISLTTLEDLHKLPTLTLTDISLKTRML